MDGRASSSVFALPRASHAGAAPIESKEYLSARWTFFTEIGLGYVNLGRLNKGAQKNGIYGEMDSPVRVCGVGATASGIDEEIRLSRRVAILFIRHRYVVEDRSSSTQFKEQLLR